LIPQNVEADRSVRIDVWVVNLRREADFGRFEWVIRGKHDGEEKDASRVRRVSLYIIDISTRYKRSDKKFRRTGPMIVACH
jgi:hypothetical protein